MLSDRRNCVACYVGIFSIEFLFQEKYEKGRFEKGYSIILYTFSLHAHRRWPVLPSDFIGNVVATAFIHVAVFSKRNIPETRAQHFTIKEIPSWALTASASQGHAAFYR